MQAVASSPLRANSSSAPVVHVGGGDRSAQAALPKHSGHGEAVRAVRLINERLSEAVSESETSKTMNKTRSFTVGCLLCCVYEISTVVDSWWLKVVETFEWLTRLSWFDLHC